MPRNSTQHIPDRASFNAAVNQGALDAYVAEDLVTSSGNRNNGELRKRVIAALEATKVTTESTKERAEKALTSGALVKVIFPNLPGPDAWADADDPDLAEAIWQKVRKDLWNQVQTGSRGAVQRAMANGDILCRAKVGDNGLPGVFITPNAKVVLRDHIGPRIAALRATVDREVADQELLIERLPAAEAKRLVQALIRPLKGLEVDAANRLAIAAETRANGPAPEPESEPES